MRWREYLDAILYVLRAGSRGALAQNLFRNPPTVGQYENAYEDSYVNIVPMNLPAEIPYLAPSQEWRIVWDSALDRRQLGERIESRFDGAVTYYDKPTGKGPAMAGDTSSGRHRCWTGRRCTRSSVSSC